MHSADRSFDDLLKNISSYLPAPDLLLIKKAYLYAQKAHNQQVRQSGEPYITHPIAVTQILADLRLDTETLCAGLLHDVLEDTSCCYSDLEKEFPAAVALLVEGVSKLTQIQFPSKMHEQAENFYKMMLAVGKDLRVIFIKIADRLHNMRTIATLSEEKRHRKSLETLEIYVPLAQRLGMSVIQKELQTRAFEQLYPKRCARLMAAFELWLDERHRNHHLLLDEVETALLADKISLQQKPFWSSKNLYSIYLKMKQQRQRFWQLEEPLHVVLIVAHEQDCYRTLGVLHRLYYPIIHKFKDYIALPKSNGYQALHTSLILKNQDIVTFQVLTPKFYLIACHGVTVYWSPYYQKHHEESEKYRSQKSFDDINFLRKTSKNSLEFLEYSKKDLNRREIYIFDSSGSMRRLPQESTAIDLAYMISTETAPFLSEVYIDGLSLPLNTRLQNGQKISLKYDSEQHIDSSWLAYVVTNKARTYIRQKLQEQQKEQAYRLGKMIFEQHLAQYNLDLDDIAPMLDKQLLLSLGLNSLEELYIHIVRSQISTHDLLKKLLTHNTAPSQNFAIDIVHLEADWEQDRIMQFAHCCLPVRGDKIVGILSPQGLSIHRENCAEIDSCGLKPEHLLAVNWDLLPKRKNFSARLHIYCVNRIGVLASISTTIARHDSNILGLLNTVSDDPTLDYLEMTISVDDLEHLESIISSLRDIRFVRVVQRV